MNLRRSIIVAQKDFSEFRKNKYIMGTILFMPLIIAVVLPSIYVVPINELGKQRGDPLDLEFNIVAEYSDVTLSNATLFDTRLENVTLSNCILQWCIVNNSIIIASNINGSRISNSSTSDTLISNSNIADQRQEINTVLVDCAVLGEDDELVQLMDVMFNVLLILLIMIPVTIPTVTASYSFVGEKTNKSLEPLLATPITDLELLLGKSGSIFLVSMGASFVSFVIAVTVVDVMTEPVLGYYPLPTVYWILGMILLAPGMCLMSIFANVLISSKVNDVRVSQQIGGIVVLPLLLFFFTSLAGFISSGIGPLLAFSAVVFSADALILFVSLRVFKREEILVNWK